MKILKNLMIIASLATLSITSYAQTSQPTLPKIWIPKTIKPKNNSNVSGEVPYFTDKKWQFLNQKIQSWLTQNFDNKNAKKFDDGMMATVRPIYQDNKTLSLAIDIQVSDFTTRYFTEYYTLDLPHHHLLTLVNYLKHKNIRYRTVQNAIHQYLQPCVEEGVKTTDNFPEHCSDMSLEYLVSSQEALDTGLDMPDDRHFFIAGKDKLGVAFNSNKFTASFVYDEKTGNVALMSP